MKRVGDVLSVIFDEGLSKKARGYSAVFSCWKDLAEKNGIAAASDHSWIKSLDKGLVWIEVDHPGWKQILQTKESKLLSDFRYRFPEMDISGISIVLCRPDSRRDELCGAPQPAPDPFPEEPPAADGYGSIGNEALKEVLMRLEKTIAAREASGAARQDGL